MSTEQPFQINKLRVRGARADGPATRIALSNLLNSADLQPKGISPAAVLIVKSMGDPLPGRIKPFKCSVTVDAEWERAGRDSLSGVLQKAARPDAGYISSAAKAVLFADEAEMLACLALDISRGEASRKWWWKLSLRTLPFHQSGCLKTLLTGKARCVPAAFHLLEKWGHSVHVVSELSAEDAVTILSVMCREHGVANIGVALAQTKEYSGSDLNEIENFRSEDQDNDIENKRSKNRMKPQLLSSGAGRGIEAPWHGRFSSLTSHNKLLKEHEALLGIALTIYNEPNLVRKTVFIRLFHDWWSSRNVPAAGEKKQTPKLSFSQEGKAGYVEKIITEDKCSGSVKYKNAKYISNVWKEISEVKLKDKTGSSLMKESAVHPEDGIDTDLIGVFYLVNLMKQLDLPESLDNESGPGGQIGAWGVLELLGRSFLGRQYEHFGGDQLWNALAELDGREHGTVPGQDFHGSSSFRLPRSWVEEDEIKSCYWAIGNQRLRIWSGNDYMLADVPLDGTDPAGQAKKEMFSLSDFADELPLYKGRFSLAPVHVLEGKYVEGINGELLQWLSSVLPYMRYRLLQALAPSGNESLDLISTLLLCRGRLYISSTHVDLVMNINNISLPVRMAGLDRDPGWLPGFGRVVKFHFE